MHTCGDSVTVLMPVYDGAAHLAAAIESVRRPRTHREFGFLVVDDGSTGASGVALADVRAPDMAFTR